MNCSEISDGLTYGITTFYLFFNWLKTDCTRNHISTHTLLRFSAWFLDQAGLDKHQISIFMLIQTEKTTVSLICVLCQSLETFMDNTKNTGTSKFLTQNRSGKKKKTKTFLIQIEREFPVKIIETTMNDIHCI